MSTDPDSGFTLLGRADKLAAMGEDLKPAEPAKSASTGPGRLAPGTQFGRYRIVREVGSGGMGAVYEAVLVDLNKRVALKVLSRELAHKPEHRERFLREGRAAARIRHPNVVEIFDVGEHDGQPFLAMEFLVGNDLRARYDKGPLSPSELLELMMPVLAAVVSAHDVQVVHRDLKPENIFLNQEHGRGLSPVVLDFGISKVLDDSSLDNLTATSTMMGTPLYMSPEQVRRSRDVDPRTDQYALAVLLYEGLSGQCAFSGNSIYDLLLKKIGGEFVPLRDLKPELPEALCAAIERAMAAERDLRYPDLRAFAAALMPFARERTRAQWSAALSAPAAEGGDAESGAGKGMAAERTGSTLRSSVKELPAISSRPRAARGRLWLAALAAIALVLIGVALSRTDSSDERAAAAASPAPADAPAPAPALAPAAALAPAPSAPPQLFPLHITADPPTAQISLDGEFAGVGTLTRELGKDGKQHTVEISADGFETRRITFTDAPPDERKVKLVALTGAAAKEGEAEAPAPATSTGRSRARKAEADAVEPAAPPQAPSTAQPPPHEEKRRTVGSNDAPVLY
jgi:serine/threonine-protein kinase